MTKVLFVRVVGALSATGLAVLFLGLIPFLDANPSAGAGIAHTSPVSVDRTLKGDRLPLPANINLAVSRVEPKQRTATPADAPFACEPAFSPISAPRLALVYGRCLS